MLNRNSYDAALVHSVKVGSYGISKHGLVWYLGLTARVIHSRRGEIVRGEAKCNFTPFLSALQQLMISQIKLWYLGLPQICIGHL